MYSRWNLDSRMVAYTRVTCTSDVHVKMYGLPVSVEYNQVVSATSIPEENVESGTVESGIFVKNTSVLK